MKLTENEQSLLNLIKSEIEANDGASVDSSLFGASHSIRGTIGSLVSKGLITIKKINDAPGSFYHIIDLL